MNDFEGLFSGNYGFKPHGKSAPMAPARSNHGTANSSFSFDFDHVGTSSTTANKVSYSRPVTHLPVKSFQKHLRLGHGARRGLIPPVIGHGLRRLLRPSRYAAYLRPATVTEDVSLPSLQKDMSEGGERWIFSGR